MLQEKGNAENPLPRKKLSAVALAMGGSGLAGAFKETVTWFDNPNERPKESNPGPRFAVVPGTDTVADSTDKARRLGAFFMRWNYSFNTWDKQPSADR
jgi:hypothetical protein